MKASQLIGLLQTAIKEVGDRDIHVYDGDSGFTPAVGISTPQDDPEGAILICDNETQESFL